MFIDFNASGGGGGEPLPSHKYIISFLGAFDVAQYLYDQKNNTPQVLYHYYEDLGIQRMDDFDPQNTMIPDNCMLAIVFKYDPLKGMNVLAAHYGFGHVSDYKGFKACAMHRNPQIDTSNIDPYFDPKKVYIVNPKTNEVALRLWEFTPVYLSATRARPLIYQQAQSLRP